MVSLVITPHAADGPRYPWADLLQIVNRRIHEQHARSEASAPLGSRHLVEAHRPPEWLGTAGASEAELAHHEGRLGMRLPPSYREFLAVSNGWDEESRSCLRLLPLAEVGWTRDVDPELGEIWGDPLGTRSTSRSTSRARSVFSTRALWSLTASGKRSTTLAGIQERSNTARSGI
ncbi:SMI1/KNR4 family protein [Nonomuraea sp. NPDC023979]|uniref:SMI1/KNR4 family protein n=1 Tax=Nonomuraea sp. NPDC023979 TaxID=3154796 RepID=UPI0033F00E93